VEEEEPLAVELEVLVVQVLVEQVGLAVIRQLLVLLEPQIEVVGAAQEVWVALGLVLLEATAALA
jgi:hypothetical protein